MLLEQTLEILFVVRIMFWGRHTVSPRPLEKEEKPLAHSHPARESMNRVSPAPWGFVHLNQTHNKIQKFCAARVLYLSSAEL